jgi:SAM-dependent methyltransferase
VSLAPGELATITRHTKLAAVLAALTSLGIPDLLADGSRTADELARSAGVRPDRLERLLRAAAGEGAMDHGRDGYALNAFSRQLCTAGDGSLAAMLLGWAMLRGGQLGLAHLEDAVRHGGSGLQAGTGLSFHDYLDAHSQEAQRYATAMESTVDSFAAGARAYDFGRFETVVDVGGGRGGLLVAVLRAHPGVRGILFDLPRVVSAAPQQLAGHPEADRVEVVAGDLFHDLQRGADGYLYSTVLRCFEDDDCLAALRACADAVRPGGQVLLVEMVLADGIPPSPSGLADVYAMAVYGGKDRSRVQWAELLDRAGFAPPTFHPVDEGPFHVVAATAR